jgi:DNA-binding CsgD family transcriptional regulator
MRGDLAEGERYARLGLEMSRRLDERQREAHTLSLLTICATLAYEDPLVPTEIVPEEGRDAAERALSIAREIDWRAGEAYFSSIFADYLTYRGELGPALAHATTGLRLAEQIEHRQWMAAAHNALARVHHELLDFAGMQRHAERELELGREVGSGIWTYRGSADLALALIGQGQFSRAEALLDATLPADKAAESCQQLLCHYARVRLFLQRAAPEQALAFVDQLRLTIPRAHEAGAVVPRLALARGQALTALGRLDEAEAELAPARVLTEARGARGLCWQLTAELATVYARQGRGDEAAQMRTAALVLIEEMTATLADEATRAGFLARANEQLAVEAPTPAPVAITPIAGLSPREMEVLQLVARGLTDAQVAEQLFISPRTVGGHLQSIYNKLGLSSRVEATRFAIRHGVG